VIGANCLDARRRVLRVRDHLGALRERDPWVLGEAVSMGGIVGEDEAELDEPGRWVVEAHEDCVPVCWFQCDEPVSALLEPAADSFGGRFRVRGCVGDQRGDERPGVVRGDRDAVEPQHALEDMRSGG
jgi:hypothetical protein